MIPYGQTLLQNEKLTKNYLLHLDRFLSRDNANITSTIVTSNNAGIIVEQRVNGGNQRSFSIGFDMFDDTHQQNGTTYYEYIIGRYLGRLNLTLAGMNIQTFFTQGIIAELRAKVNDGRR